MKGEIEYQNLIIPPTVSASSMRDVDFPPLSFQQYAFKLIL